MPGRNLFTKILAVAGTLLAWVPLLAPILFSAVALIQQRRLRLDYLMPAELFPVALVGGALLIWSSLRARSHTRLLLWSMLASIILLVGSQGVAVLSGLASGATEPAGLWFSVVLAMLLLYVAALIAVGIGGTLLLRELFTLRVQLRHAI